MKKLEFLAKSLALVALLALTMSCAVKPTATETITEAGQIGLEIKPGTAFTNWGWAFIIPFKKGPQMAAWVVDGQGTYRGTLFATGKSARNDWMAAPAQGRPESLPVWSAARNIGDSQEDAVSAASSTSLDTQNLASNLVLEPGSYQVFLEVNLSYDWNATWGKGLPENDSHFNGVNGQPSIVYQASIQVGNGPARFILKPIGVGSATGTDGQIRQDFAGIDSALNILESGTIVISQ